MRALHDTMRRMEEGADRAEDKAAESRAGVHRRMDELVGRVGHLETSTATIVADVAEMKPVTDDVKHRGARCDRDCGYGARRQLCRGDPADRVGDYRQGLIEAVRACSHKCSVLYRRSHDPVSGAYCEAYQCPVSRSHYCFMPSSARGRPSGQCDRIRRR
ncbi:DUF1515 family protein [Ensifer canadensis]|uniref:DUF1515 family protein n=1 Tax=Ensifer canadensis TaxID=555315 RepID=UPI00307DB03B